MLVNIMLINTVFTCLQSLFTNKCLSKQNVYKHRVCLLTCLFTKKNEARVCLLVCLRKSGVFVYLFVYYRNRKLCLFTCLFTYIFEVNTLVNISVYKHPNLVNTPILFINSTPCWGEFILYAVQWLSGFWGLIWIITFLIFRIWC